MTASVKVFGLVLCAMLLFGVTFAIGQETPNTTATPTSTLPPLSTSFEVAGEIGRALPRSIIYDPIFERLAIVDAYNRLFLADALTYETQHVLHEIGEYNDIAFSHDGRWLALANGVNMELWNTETGTLVAQLDNLNSIVTHGPITFSDDDTLVLFNGTYPAPPALRRSENDTSIIPWIWNIATAREEAVSAFPNEVEAYSFFDYRNGLVLGPDNRIVAALPGRLHILDAYTLDVLFEIETFRYEPDPLTVWFSARDNVIYVRPVNTNSLIQVDTQQGELVEIPLNRTLSRADLVLVGGVELGSQAQVIGVVEDRDFNPLIGVFLGEDYRRYDLSRVPLTVTLIDFVIPPSGQYDRTQALLFVFDEENELGGFYVTSLYNTQQMTLHPDGARIALRRTTTEEQVEIYNLSSGQRELSVIPAVRGFGYYSYLIKNRVLAFNTTGDAVLSDFERYDAVTGAVIGQDLRYSRRFDRFFFTDDNAGIVTLSGTEWRLWDIASAEVVRREVLPLRGDIVATSRDGYRYLTTYYASNDQPDGRAIYDVGTGENRAVSFTQLEGRSIIEIIPSPDWEHFFVIYSENFYGPYYPGNEVALYSMDQGQLWFMAGDDLPGVNNRLYGWTDNDTVYIYGEDIGFYAPNYPIEYDPSGMPACLALNAESETERQEFIDTWFSTTESMTAQQVTQYANALCGVLGGLFTVDNADGSMVIEPTPIITPTAIVIAGVPVCLTAAYPSQADELAATWRSITEGLTSLQIAEAEALLCEGIGDVYPSYYDGQISSAPQWMFIDMTGERSVGNYIAPPSTARPLQPILDEYARLTERSMGTIALSPNEELVAASSLPGELVIFRLVTHYETLLGYVTATAYAQIEAANLVAVLPSPTPTFAVVGTAQPTLTPTITPTAPPLPQNPASSMMQADEVQDICPSETLFSVDAPPPSYAASGRLVGPASGEYLWVVEPETGVKAPDEAIPSCGIIVNCQFSPDGAWVLVQGGTQILVVRPDGSNSRLLFDDDDRWPESIRWSGIGVLEYEVFDQVPDRPEGYFDTMYQRDILGVFPDPPLWLPEVELNYQYANIISRQPGGALVLVSTDFSTGTGLESQYYLYNSETGASEYVGRGSLDTAWDIFGRRLFYTSRYDGFYHPIYMIDIATGERSRVSDGGWLAAGGVWSPDGRYSAYRTDRRTQQVAIWDSQTGLTRTYCIPETGARLYEGSFTWSPDSHYVALLTPLPQDETQEGVGQHVLILNMETGEVVDVTTGMTQLLVWAVDPASGGE